MKRKLFFLLCALLTMIGVGEVKSEEVKSEESDNVYYDLAGRRIAKPERGFYIHGGKKYVK